MSDKPTYLGESALPPKFDLQLNRLARRVVASERGSAAVAGAMQDSLSRTAVEAANAVQAPPTLQDWLRKTIAERPFAALLLGLAVGLCLGSRRSEAAALALSGHLITAQEEDRARLGRELHDDVSQRLASLAINAGLEARKLPAPADGAAMRTMREDLTRLGQDVHALAYRLHPSILNDLGLPEALKAECESFSQTQSLKIDVSVAQVPENVSDDVGLGLFRIAQESLRNVARHASAGQVEVRLRHLNGGLQLTVRDDGIGFDPTQAPIKASLGLASMRQRAALVGGKLKIDGKPSHGTTITAWVPLLGGHGAAEWLVARTAPIWTRG